MSDAKSTNRLTLGDALRALPNVAPAHDDWPALAAQLRRDSGFGIRDSARRNYVRRLVVPAALAATVFGLVVFANRMSAVKPDSAIPNPGIATVAPSAASVVVNGTAANSSATTARVAQLQQRSRELERWLRQTGADAAPLPGQDLAAAAEIENLIGLVDVELSAPQQTQALALWQRRVGLLEDLTALRYSNYRLAAGSLIAASTQID